MGTFHELLTSFVQTASQNRKQNSTRQARYVQGNAEERSCNHCCGGKAVLYSERLFVPLVIPHAMSMLHIILTSVACPDL